MRKIILAVMLTLLGCNESNAKIISLNSGFVKNEIKTTEVDVTDDEYQAIIEVLTNVFKTKEISNKYFTEGFLKSFSPNLRKSLFSKENYMAMEPLKVTYGRKKSFIGVAVQVYWSFEGWEGNQTYHFIFEKDGSAWKINFATN